MWAGCWTTCTSVSACRISTRRQAVVKNSGFRSFGKAWTAKPGMTPNGHRRSPSRSRIRMESSWTSQSVMISGRELNWAEIEGTDTRSRGDALPKSSKSSGKRKSQRPCPESSLRDRKRRAKKRVPVSPPLLCGQLHPTSPKRAFGYRIRETSDHSACMLAKTATRLP
jgi:hypothetical protein